jgi:hypothetical protein
MPAEDDDSVHAETGIILDGASFGDLGLTWVDSHRLYIIPHPVALTPMMIVTALGASGMEGG